MARIFFMMVVVVVVVVVVMIVLRVLGGRVSIIQIVLLALNSFDARWSNIGWTNFVRSFEKKTTFSTSLNFRTTLQLIH
jgi:hypothetical protein